MGSSHIFRLIWTKNLHLVSKKSIEGFDGFELLPKGSKFQQSFKELCDGVNNDSLPRLPLNLNYVIVYILVPSLNLTHQVMRQLIDGNIKIQDALQYMESFESLQMELNRLNNFFETGINQTQIQKCVDRLKCANNMKDCIVQSSAILETARVLELKGDFKSVEIIKEKVI